MIVGDPAQAPSGWSEVPCWWVKEGATSDQYAGVVSVVDDKAMQDYNLMCSLEVRVRMPCTLAHKHARTRTHALVETNAGTQPLACACVHACATGRRVLQLVPY